MSANEHYSNTLLPSGDAAAIVRGIATAFLPTHRIVEEAAAAGLNLLIAHEGVYYSHRDGFDRATADPVYAKKRRLIEDGGIAVYRCHDACHHARPDLIAEGLLRALRWEACVEKRLPYADIVRLPEPMTARAVAEHAKRRLSLSSVRFAGDPSMPCRRIGLTVGYRGGGAVCLPLFQTHAADLVISGEGPEWETPEYVRDAVRQGEPKSLLYLGHAESEEPGMRLLAERLQRQFPGLPVRFLSDRPVFERL